MTLEGNPWFVAKDVCELLGYKQSHSGGFSSHLQYHLDTSERKTLSKGATESFSGPSLFSGTASTCALISESGLYKLILNSKKPNAHPFQDWVTKEVLPSIRKTGSFVTGQPSLVENPQMSALEVMMAQAKKFVGSGPALLPALSHHLGNVTKD